MWNKLICITSVNIQICASLFLRYYSLIPLKIFEKNTRKKYDLDSVNFGTVPPFSCLSCLKKIRGGIARAIEHYAEAANKYMNNFGLSKSSL